MKLQDLALEEQKGVFPKLCSFLFMRLVTMKTPQYYGGYVVLGVPPWRELEARDCYDKTVLQVYP